MAPSIQSLTRTHTTLPLTCSKRLTQHTPLMASSIYTNTDCSQIIRRAAAWRNKFSAHVPSCTLQKKHVIPSAASPGGTVETAEGQYYYKRVTEATSYTHVPLRLHSPVWRQFKKTVIKTAVYAAVILRPLAPAGPGIVLRSLRFLSDSRGSPF